jgi:dihydrolipoamide dehydrogenase
MVVGELSERVDVAVIGAGPGGYPAALRLADHGRRVILIDEGDVGGVCLNVGCIPSKTLIHQAELAHLATTSKDTGVGVSIELDPVAMLTHRRKVIRDLTGGVHQLLASAGVETWAGTARFAQVDRLAVEAEQGVRHLEFDHCVIATGSRPVVLPDLVTGDSGIEVLDSTGALELNRIPGSMVVIGGGYVGVELGTAWAKLGCRVRIIEAADRLLPGLAPELAEVVHGRLEDLGVTVQTNSTAVRLDDRALITTNDGIERRHQADCVVVAVGRRPNTDRLSIENTPVRLDDRGLIVVTPNRRAAGPIFAIGDVTAGPALAHKATAEAHVAADAIAGLAAAFDPAAIPEVVFSDPEVASVGLDESTAMASDPQSRVFRFPYLAGARARTVGDRAGFVQLVADGAGTIVGAQMAGHGVSELIAEAALAIEMAATVTDVADTIHPHPTMSEAVMEAAHGLEGRPLHVRR